MIGSGSYTITKPTGLTPPACSAAMARLCDGARRASAGDCLVCAGTHQKELQGAGCNNPSLEAWCSGIEPPPSPPDPDPPPPACPASTPGPSGTGACALQAPGDPEFESICHPGSFGHAGGAEQPNYRCPRVNYTEGVFRCACCGAPLFYAIAKFQPEGDGWPAFHGQNATIARNFSKLGVCSPGGTEVVCEKCGTHLGDYFAPGALGQGYSYYCIDGVCLLPPDAQPGKVCEPAATAPVPSKAAAYTALRYMMREQGVAAVAAKLAQRAQSHDEAQHTHVH